MPGSFSGVCSCFKVRFIDEVAPALMAIRGVLRILKLLQFCFCVMPATDNSNHSGGPVGPTVIADDRVGRREIVACQREPISSCAEKRSRDSLRVRISHPVSPMISAVRISYRISMKLRASFVHVHRTTVKHRSIQCRNSGFGFRRLGHLHEGDAPRFARIPVLDDRDRFDRTVGCKQFPQLLLRHRDIQVSDKNVSQKFILLLIFPKSRNQERTWNFKSRS